MAPPLEEVVKLLFNTNTIEGPNVSQIMAGILPKLGPSMVTLILPEVLNVVLQMLHHGDEGKRRVMDH